jgi:hypothetical protein
MPLILMSCTRLECAGPASIWWLVCFIVFYFAPVCLKGLTLPAFYRKAFFALLPVDILKR